VVSLAEASPHSKKLDLGVHGVQSALIQDNPKKEEKLDYDGKLK
jgi:hypothetical protein